MAVELYKHQLEAIEKLHTGSILCGGVGTGKSRTALAYFYTRVCGCKLPKRNSIATDEVSVPLYIITTARKRDTYEWEHECAPFLLEPIIDSWNNIKKYTDVEHAFFIFDEQRLVGSGAWVKAFLKIVKANDWILLTATPGDSWIDYCPVFIANGFYRNRTDFISQHVIYHRYVKFPKIERYVGVQKLEKCRRAIVVNMEYKKEAIQHHEWIQVGYDDSVYDSVAKNRWDIYNQEPIENASQMCYILRKVVNSDRRRLKAIANVLKRHPKAIIFYNFDYELELLHEFCDVMQYPVAEWNGHKHQQLLTGNRWVYLVQYNSGAEGWNCITTDTIIFFSQNYSYRMTVQASGRIDRMNTPFKNLYYYHLFSDSSIDKGIKHCLNKKKDFNEKTFFEASTRYVQESLSL